MSNNEKLDICNQALLRAAGIKNPKPQYEEPENHMTSSVDERAVNYVLNSSKIKWNSFSVHEIIEAYEAAKAMKQPRYTPCPFCGSANISVQRGRNVWDAPEFYAQCATCLSMNGTSLSEENAEKVWNRRETI